MKKKFSFLSILVLILFYGCEQIDLAEGNQTIPQVTQQSGEVNYNVSLRSAKYIAQSLDGEEKKDIKNIEPVVYEKDTLFYIVNLEEGWQVIAGDKRLEPILASDTKGKLSTDDLSNPGIGIWLNDLADQIVAIKRSTELVEFDENIKLWTLIDKAAYFTKENLNKYYKKHGMQSVGGNLKAAQRLIDGPGEPRLVRRLVSVTSTPYTTHSQKGPLMSTKWGQGYPWNENNVPLAWGKRSDGTDGWVECPTGCTAVAMAQIIYYANSTINKPTGLYHNVSSTGYIRDGKNYSVQFSRGAYSANSTRWSQMPLNRYDWARVSNASFVGDLMADVGNRVGMKYGATGSSSNPSTGAFSNFSLASLTKDYAYSSVYSELNRNMPVLVTAFAKKVNYRKWFLGKWRYKYENGHAWVIDGYRRKKKTYTYNYVWEFVGGELPLEPYSAYSPYYEDLASNLKSSNLLSSDAYPGKRETETRTSYQTYLLMNWGWNGFNDTGEYTTGVSDKWKGSSYDFQYLKKIYYNFK